MFTSFGLVYWHLVAHLPCTVEHCHEKKGNKSVACNFRCISTKFLFLSPNVNTVFSTFERAIIWQKLFLCLQITEMLWKLLDFISGNEQGKGPNVKITRLCGVFKVKCSILEAHFGTFWSSEISTAHGLNDDGLFDRLTLHRIYTWFATTFSWRLWWMRTIRR